MTQTDYNNGYDGTGSRDDASFTEDFDRGVADKAAGKERWSIRPQHPAAGSGAQREKLAAQPYDLVPFQEMTEAYARVAEFGAKKCAPWNWSKGLPRVQLLGSLLRHAFAYLRGEDRDKETGLLHTDHILWNAAALAHNVHHGLEDDRRKEPLRQYHD